MQFGRMVVIKEINKAKFCLCFGVYCLEYSIKLVYHRIIKLYFSIEGELK